MSAPSRYRTAWPVDTMVAPEQTTTRQRLAAADRRKVRDEARRAREAQKRAMVVAALQHARNAGRIAKLTDDQLRAEVAGLNTAQLNRCIAAMNPKRKARRNR